MKNVAGLGLLAEAQMNQFEMNEDVSPSTANSPGKWVYVVGQMAIWAALLIFRRWVGGELMGLRTIGVIHFVPSAVPKTALGWFTLLHDQPLLGLTLLYAFDVGNFVLAGAVFLVLFAVLKRTDRGFMILALTLGFLGIALYIASNPAFPMLALSNQYAAATIDAQRFMILNAGETVMATKNPVSLGQNLAFGLFHAAGMIISVVMLRSGIFGRATAVLGILFNGFGLGFPLGIALVPGNQFIPGAAWVVAVIFWVLWYIRIALTLRRLGLDTSDGSGAHLRNSKRECSASSKMHNE